MSQQFCLPIVASLETLEHVRFVELSKCNTFLLFIICEERIFLHSAPMTLEFKVCDYIKYFVYHDTL